METQHRPVLLNEVIEYLAGEGEMVSSIFDGTLGGGGHSEALLERLPNAVLLAADRDEAALRRAGARLARFSDRIALSAGSFEDIGAHWETMPEPLRQRAGGDAPSFDRIILDLGISSDQLDDSERGFSFSRDGELDMRMNRSEGPTAADILNSSDEAELRRIFLRGGVNPQLARSLSREVVKRRPFSRTAELKLLCDELVPLHRRRTAQGRSKHPAAVPFQALRIEVNQEFSALEKFLENAPAALAPGGRLAVISFHSLEDKAVARTMRRWSQPGPGDERRPGPAFGQLLTKSAVEPSAEEMEANPRARSARMRVFQRGEGKE